MVLHKDAEDSLINEFLMGYKGTVIVESKKDEVPTKQVVIIVDSFLSFMKILLKLKPDLKGKYFAQRSKVFGPSSWKSKND